MYTEFEQTLHKNYCQYARISTPLCLVLKIWIENKFLLHFLHFIMLETKENLPQRYLFKFKVS